MRAKPFYIFFPKKKKTQKKSSKNNRRRTIWKREENKRIYSSPKSRYTQREYGKRISIKKYFRFCFKAEKGKRNFFLLCFLLYVNNFNRCGKDLRNLSYLMRCVCLKNPAKNSPVYTLFCVCSKKFKRLGVTHSELICCILPIRRGEEF